MNRSPGLILLFGSGETMPVSGPAYELVARRLDRAPEIAILETPAGFEPNSADVAGNVGRYLLRRLQNYQPKVTLVPARRRYTPQSPDDPQILAPLQTANWLFLGPGSPTYAVRQLQDSLAWQMVQAGHRSGTALVLASAATLAVSRFTLPVYEIYKVGQDLHWQFGLDLLGAYGLPLVIIPHWNNQDGGEALDTSRCFMGRARFAQLLALLPAGNTVLGLDEHTALVIDLAAGTGRVMGRGRVVLLRGTTRQEFAAGQTFPLTLLGPFALPPDPAGGIPAGVWQSMINAQQAAQAATPPQPPDSVLALMADRSTARQQKEWATADRLRDQIATLGWQVLDTPDGPQLLPLEES